MSKFQAEFEGQILKALFDGFANENVRHAVLRGFENLPQSTSGRDVGIVVHPDDLSAAFDIVTGIVTDHGLLYGDYLANERSILFLLVGRDANNRLLQLSISFIIRGAVYGIEFLSAEEMLRGRRTYNSVMVVSDPVPFLDKWMSHLLTGRPLHPKYDAGFAQIAQAETAVLTSYLKRFLPAARAEALISRLADGAGSQIMLSGPERHLALLRLWQAQGMSALGRSGRFLGNRLRNRLMPNGLFLSVSGPAGSGKTTVINLVQAQLGQIFGDDAIHRAHFCPENLSHIPDVAKNAPAVDTFEEEYDTLNQAKPLSLLGSLARLGRYWLDYMGGYFRSVRPLLRRRQIVLANRCYYDLIADGSHSRIAVPQPLQLFMGKMLPLPQFSFFLHVDTEELLRRTQALTLESIAALNSRYGTLADCGLLIPIDNNGEPQTAAAAIVNQICFDRHARARKEIYKLVR